MSKAVYNHILAVPNISFKYLKLINQIDTFLVVKKGKARRFSKIMNDGKKKKPSTHRKFKLISL